MTVCQFSHIVGLGRHNIFLIFYFFNHQRLPRCGVFTRAKVSTLTSLAPLFIITLLHSLTVVPVVKTSSTRQTLAPEKLPAGRTLKAPVRFFRRAALPSSVCGTVFIVRCSQSV
jgi:hypothetical protein